MYHAVFTVYENKKVLFVNNGFAGNMAVLFNYCYVADDVEMVKPWPCVLKMVVSTANKT